jgi:hypothetical protein
MSFDLTTTDLVKGYLGITSTTYDTIIDTIVTQTSCEIEIYCNRQFELDVYIEQGIGNGEDVIRLPNTPVESVLYSASGSSSAIDITYDGSATGNVDVQTERVVLTEGLATTSITITEANTISDVAASITALANWTATASGNVDNYPGFSLLQHRYRILENGQGVSACAVTGQFSMTKEADGRYRVPQMGKGVYGIASDFDSFSTDSTDSALPGSPTSILPYQPLASGPVWMVIYQGGYAVDAIPAGLEQLATEIAANAFRGISKDTGIKSEKIGDYSYVASDGVKGVGSNYILSSIHAQKQRLDFYSFKVL